MKNKTNRIFLFFPLASVGGTESVHADIIKSLSEEINTVYIRYKTNVWKGKEFASTTIAKSEGSAMLPVFSKYAHVTFADRFLEAPRFGRFIRKFFITNLSRKINRCKNPIVIFWHRESIDFLMPNLKDHVRIVDIMHNNSNNIQADPSYLVNDWVPRLNHRILVSEGLKKWLIPLYQKEAYPNEYFERISVIEHSVQFPSEGFIQKDLSTLRILFIGRDSIEKRFPLFLEIGKRLQLLQKKSEVHIIGPKQEDYPEFDTNGFFWHGEIVERNKIEEIYRKINFIILTSSSEGFPKVLAEAMAFSCIPIATQVGDIEQHIASEINGYLTNPEKCIEETIMVIKSLLMDTEKYKEIAQNSYFYAKQKFTEERFNHEWKKIIDSLC